MKINYVVRASKVRKNGLAPVEMSIIVNGDRKVISLDRQINPKHWNSKTQSVKGNKELNTYLQAIIQKLYTTQTELIQHNIPVTLDTLLDAYKHGVTPLSSIVALYKKHNEEYIIQYNNNQISKATLLKYQKAQEYLQKYIQEKYNKTDIQLSQITPSFIESHYNYLLQYMNNNSAMKIMKRLKKIIQLAIDEGYIQTNPWKLKIKEDKVTHNPLSIDQINTIKNKDFHNDRLNKVRDLFILQCYTGLAFIDMQKISQENINNLTIIIKRQKTEIESIIPMLPEVADILLKYNYKLPVISNQKMNAYLKEIGDICKIPQPLHTHLGRHTFATLLINNNVPLPVIARALGHSNTRITEKTYARLNHDTVCKEILKVADKLS